MKDTPTKQSSPQTAESGKSGGSRGRSMPARKPYSIAPSGPPAQLFSFRSAASIEKRKLEQKNRLKAHASNALMMGRRDELLRKQIAKLQGKESCEEEGKPSHRSHRSQSARRRRVRQVMARRRAARTMATRRRRVRMARRVRRHENAEAEANMPEAFAEFWAMHDPEANPDNR